MGDISSLQKSIQDFGVLQPIIIDTKNNLIAGYRRLTACKELSLSTIPVTIVEIEGEMDSRELELIENRQRLNMLWYEEMKLDVQLHDHYLKTKNNWTLAKTAEALNIKPSELTRRVYLTQYISSVPQLKQYENSFQAERVVKQLFRDLSAKKDTDKIKEEISTEEGFEEVEGEEREEKKKIPKWLLSAYQIGDAIEGMKGEGSETYHFAEVDPPYSIGLRDLRQDGDKTYQIAGYQEIEKESYPTFLRDTAREVYRTLKDNTFCVWWFGIEWYETCRSILTETGFACPVVPAIWLKARGSTNQPETILGNRFETFFLLRKNRPVMTKPGKGNVLEYPQVKPSESYHATQRPLPLMLDILSNFAPLHANVLVPFLGSGVTLQAAAMLEMMGKGWDKDPNLSDNFLSTAAILIKKEL